MMTDSELRRAWKNKSLSKQGMIRCLAELNGCTFADMHNRLVLAGIIKGEFVEQEEEHERKTYTYVRNGVTYKTWSSDEIKELVRMKDKGYTYEQMARALDRTVHSIKQRLYTL